MVTMTFNKNIFEILKNKFVAQILKTIQSYCIHINQGGKLLLR